MCLLRLLFSFKFKPHTGQTTPSSMVFSTVQCFNALAYWANSCPHFSHLKIFSFLLGIPFDFLISFTAKQMKLWLEETRVSGTGWSDELLTMSDENGSDGVCPLPVSNIFPHTSSLFTLAFVLYLGFRIGHWHFSHFFLIKKHDYYLKFGHPELMAPLVTITR